MSAPYDLYEFKFADRPVYFLFYKINPPYRNHRGQSYKHTLKLQVFFKIRQIKEIQEFKDKNTKQLGFHTASVDYSNNIYGHVAEVASFTSSNEQEKKAMKGLGKLMLCTMTRYLVDSYGIDLNHMYYAEAGAGTPYFSQHSVHKLYHPEMCALTNSNMNELISSTTTESGRRISPVLSDDELAQVLNAYLFLPSTELWDRESQLGPVIDYNQIENEYISDYESNRKLAEKILTEKHRDGNFKYDRGKFIRACIREIYPTTWKDIQQILQTPDYYGQILKMLKESGREFNLDEYYESVICEIIATHRLLDYYQRELAFEPYNKNDGRLVRMRVYLSSRLEKCDMNEKMFPKKEEEEEKEDYMEEDDE